MSKKESNCKVSALTFKEVKSPEVAYVLGLLWADGYLNQRNGCYHVRIEFAQSDADEVKNVFMATGNWSFNTRHRNENWKPITIFSAYNHFLYDYLYSLGYGTKSEGSAKYVIDSIPVEFRPYWWRGYFDGDGCVSIHIPQSVYCVVFSSSYNQNWDFAEELFDDLGVRHFIYQKSYVCKNNGRIHRSSSFKISSIANVNKFYQYIYADSLEQFGFSRKLAKLLFLQSLPMKAGRVQKNINICITNCPFDISECVGEGVVNRRVLDDVASKSLLSDL